MTVNSAKRPLDRRFFFVSLIRSQGTPNEKRRPSPERRFKSQIALAYPLRASTAFQPPQITIAAITALTASPSRKGSAPT